MAYLRTGLSLTATLTLSVTALAAPAFAQEGPARLGVLSFSQGLELTDNAILAVSPTGDSLISTTRLGLDIGTETRTESLRFNVGTELIGDIFGETDDDFEFGNYSAGVNYRREGASSLFALTGTYRERQLDDEVLDPTSAFFGIDLGPDVLIIDSGTVTATGLGARLQTGIGGPFELDLKAEYADRDYEDVVDADLVDNTRSSFDALARLRPNQALTYRLRAGYDLLEEDDLTSTETTTTYFGAGVEGETAGGLSFFGDLLYDRAEIDTGGTTVLDGIGVDLGLTQERNNGTFGLAVASRVDDEGRRTSAIASRAMELPTGALSFSLGVVDEEGDNSLRLAGGVNYLRATPRGGLTVVLSQDITASDGDVFRDTRLEVGFVEEINMISAFEARLGYVMSNDLGGSDDDQETVATLTYRRDLTEDWQMRAGYERTILSTEGGTDRTQNSIFLNVERDFAFGF